MSGYGRGDPDRQHMPREFPPAEWHTCRRKVVYLRKKQALAAIAEHHPGDPDIHPYNCPYCRNWHIGHSQEAP